MWQTLERKAAFIAQVTRGDLPDRDVDDIGDQALSFAEVKALATGDPLVLEKAGVDADVARLSRLERAHHDDQHRLRRTFDTATQRANRCTQRADQLESVLERVVDTHGDRFAMTVDGRHHTKRMEAGADLKMLLAGRLEATPPETTSPLVPTATLGGLTVASQTITVIEDEIRLVIPDAHIELTYNRHDWQTADPAMIVSRLERQLQRLPETLASTRAEGQTAATEAARAEARIGQPWEHTDELGALRRRQKEIDETLAASAEPAPSPDPASTTLGASPSVTSQLAADVDLTRQRLDSLERCDMGPAGGLSL
jgi:outer membrane murein-binding lipoprotein Lpp